MLNRPRLNEVIATDTYFSAIKSIEGYTCSQVYYGCTSRTIHVYGMKTESEFPSTYQDFLRDQGIPHTLRRDNAKSQKSQVITEINRELIVADSFTEPHHPHQNPAEGGGVKYLKSRSEILMNQSGAPEHLWFLCHQYLADVHNVSANPSNNYQIPNQVSGGILSIFRIFCNFTGFNPSTTLILFQNILTRRRNLVILLDSPTTQVML